MRKIAGVTAGVVLILALVGCGAPEDGGVTSQQGVATIPATTPATNVFEQELPDGRSVTCIWASGLKKGGLSCDWENAW